ncbi:uncharacterized protein EV154DRAFT_483226 [Mucor mucedo]|uniref:uncharacterized protein n=1 Tax=Mucor mucedo TaxID=29922 RepID=UPI00222106C8|nr:uncharacterized protein EV154DRAFT_483226 [Mucor mucedo]KAI7889356.1 hypothetical protein EV154DRAFT_483226 [Mucor mucedo]
MSNIWEIESDYTDNMRVPLEYYNLPTLKVILYCIYWRKYDIWNGNDKSMNPKLPTELSLSTKTYTVLLWKFRRFMETNCPTTTKMESVLFTGLRKGSLKAKDSSKLCTKHLIVDHLSKNNNAIYGNKSSRNIKKRSLDSTVEESTNLHDIFGIDKKANNHRIEEKNKMENGITALFSTYDDDLPYDLNNLQHNGDYKVTSDEYYNFTGQLNADLKNRMFGGFVVEKHLNLYLIIAVAHYPTKIPKKDDDSSSVCSMDSLNIQHTLDEGWIGAEEMKSKFTTSPNLATLRG